MTVDELRKYITTDKDDQVLEDMLQALELSIRNYTNNNFINRAYRETADIVGGLFISDELIPYSVGDTVYIYSKYNDGLYTVGEVDENTFTVNEPVVDEDKVRTVKVSYPMDVKLGVIDMIRWKLKNEATSDGTLKSIQSETISRHSVTYAQDVTESDIDGKFGVPKKYVAFLRYYRKARF